MVDQRKNRFPAQEKCIENCIEGYTGTTPHFVCASVTWRIGLPSKKWFNGDQPTSGLMVIFHGIYGGLMESNGIYHLVMTFTGLAMERSTMLYNR